MKILLLVFFVGYVSAKEAGKVRSFGPEVLDQITAEVDKSRDNFPDPFIISELSYELPANQLGRVFSGKIGIRNLVLTGVKNAQFKASIFPPLVTFKLPHAKLEVDYSLDLSVFDVASLKVDGSGHILLELTGVDLEVEINPTLFQGPKESLKNIKVGLGGAKFSITGLLGDEALSHAVSKWVSSNVMPIFKKQIGYVVDLVKKFLNAILPHYIKLMNRRG